MRWEVWWDAVSGMLNDSASWITDLMSVCLSVIKHNDNISLHLRSHRARETGAHLTPITQADADIRKADSDTWHPGDPQPRIRYWGPDTDTQWWEMAVIVTQWHWQWSPLPPLRTPHTCSVSTLLPPAPGPGHCLAQARLRLRWSTLAYRGQAWAWPCVLAWPGPRPGSPTHQSLLRPPTISGPDTLGSDTLLSSPAPALTPVVSQLTGGDDVSEVMPGHTRSSLCDSEGPGECWGCGDLTFSLCLFVSEVPGSVRWLGLQARPSDVGRPRINNARDAEQKKKIRKKKQSGSQKSL